MDKKTVVYQNTSNKLDITFPYDENTVKLVKTLKGKEYNNETKTWSAPALLINLHRLQQWEFEFDAQTAFLFEKLRKKRAHWKPENLSYLPYQTEGISFLEMNEGLGLLCDEPGLGKTIQVLGYISNTKEVKKTLVVCPSSVKYNWEREALKWLPSGTRVQVLEGRKADTLNNKCNMYIINYDILHAWKRILSNFQFDLIVLDECHYIKTQKTQRTKAVFDVCKTIPRRIPLSGTPALNRPIELYNAITLVDPTIFKSYFSYAHRYCGARHNGFGWVYDSSSNEEELHDLLTNVMIRRKKEDVLKDLPEKRYTYVPFHLHKNCEYNKATKDFMGWLAVNKSAVDVSNARKAQHLVKVAYLRRLAVEAVLEDAILWVKDFLATGQKLVLFAIHKDIIKELEKEFKGKCVVIDGSTSPINREKAVNKFQKSKRYQLFIGNIQAAGVGITLTASSNVAFLELPWTPGELDQACDRCHRIGQKNAVNIYYLLGADTIEEHLAQIIDRKRDMLSKVLDGKEYDKESVFETLMKQYVKEGK